MLQLKGISAPALLKGDYRDTLFFRRDRCIRSETRAVCPGYINLTGHPV